MCAGAQVSDSRLCGATAGRRSSCGLAKCQQNPHQYSGERASNPPVLMCNLPFDVRQQHCSLKKSVRMFGYLTKIKASDGVVVVPMCNVFFFFFLSFRFFSSSGC